MRKPGGYPEPLRWKKMPASAMFIRQVKGIELDDVTFSFQTPDYRPPFVLEDVSDATFNRVTAPRMDDVPMFVKKDVSGFHAD